jgi:hypothetical protein
VPENVVGGELDRCLRVGDDSVGGDGLDDSDLDDSNDGDDRPQDQDYDVDPDEDHVDDCEDDVGGEAAPDIVRGYKLGFIPGPMTRSRFG